MQLTGGLMDSASASFGQVAGHVSTATAGADGGMSVDDLPAMQMYATWRKKRVHRFASGVERMRSRLEALQAEREAELAAAGAMGGTGGLGMTGMAGLDADGQPSASAISDMSYAELDTTYKQAAMTASSALGAACRTLVYTMVDVACLQGELNLQRRHAKDHTAQNQTQLVNAATALRKMKAQLATVTSEKKAREEEAKKARASLKAAREENATLRDSAHSLEAEVSGVDSDEKLLNLKEQLKTSRKQVEALELQLEKTQRNCERVLTKLSVVDPSSGAKGPAAKNAAGTKGGRSLNSEHELAEEGRPKSARGVIMLAPFRTKDGASGGAGEGGDAAAAGGGVADDGGVSATTAALAASLDEASAPTRKEVVDYAAYLGLEPKSESDQEFMWIAEEALCAPLPAGWSEHYRPEYGAVYYFHAQSNQSKWHHPLEDYYRQLLSQLKMLKRDIQLEAAASKSLFTISQIGSMANALMKAHNEKLASMLLEEVPGDRVDLAEHAREKSERKSKAKSKDPKSELAELKKQQARLQGGGDGNDADAEN